MKKQVLLGRISFLVLFFFGVLASQLIGQSINMSYPTGGEYMYVGANKNITWESSNVDSVKIEFSTSGSSTLVTGGTASASNYYSGNPPANAFDGDTVYSGWGNNSILPVWLEYALATPVAVNKYSLICSSNQTNWGAYEQYNPSNWDFQGFNGTDWVTLHSVTYANMTQNIRQTYTFSNSIAYSKYRIYIYSCESSTWTNITELSLYGGDNNWSTVTESTLASTGSYTWNIPNTPTTTGYLKISDVSNSTLYDINATPFTIASDTGVVLLTAPNGGESFIVGNTFPITWGSVDVNNVKLEYSTNGGSSWNLIATNILASTGTYTWTIPYVSSTHCKVRISNTGDSSVFDESDSEFSIFGPTLTLSSPNGGEVWKVGTNQYITWAGTGSISYVYMRYSTDGGNNWTAITTAYFSTGYYQWTVPNAPSTNCLFKIEDYYNGAVYDISNNTFTIAQPDPVITVTAPNNAESYTVGSSQYISWSYTNVQNVDIEYSINNGSTWMSIVDSITASSGSYYWTVPSTPSVQCKVRISDHSNPNVNDISDNVFKIVTPILTVTSPNGGETYTGGNYQNITWQASNIGAYVNLYYSSDGGSTWNYITNAYTSNYSYNWYIPTTISSIHCLVKVSDYYNNAMADSSNAEFTINAPTPILTITTPNGGESWATGSSQYIYWSQSYSTNVKLEYSTDSAATWNTIIASTAASSEYYYWTVPATPSTKCYIKISDVAVPSSYDINDNAFSIVSPGITITQPNGGESWPIGTTKQVVWTSTGVGSYVTIDYSTNGGSSWNTLISGTSNSGSYNWLVTSPASTTCKFRVTDYYNASYSDVSDANFSITALNSGSIQVSSQNSNETYKPGNSAYIYWDGVNTSGQYMVEYSINAGSTWNLITDNTTNNYIYWTVPNTPSNTCKIRVSDVSNSSIQDLSNGYFRIVIPTILVSAPNGGEVWQGATNHNISWSGQNLDYPYYYLYYSTDSGSIWNYITTVYSTTPYNWSVPNVNSTNCLFKVVYYYDSNIYDISNATFTITPANPQLTLTTPNGGDSWAVGSTNYIYWSPSYFGSGATIKLEYSYDNGSSWSVINSSVDVSTTYYGWLIPNTPSTTCLVKITSNDDSNIYDISQSVFTIYNPNILVTTPNGGEVWTPGQTKTIYWSSTGISSYVNIEYSVDSGLTYNSVAYGTYNYGYYSWYVPNTPSTNCIIKVSDYYTSTILDSSDAVFTIAVPQSNVILTGPNGGEVWASGTTHSINWTYNFITNVKLEYSSDNGSTWNTIISSTPASNYSYSWLTPGTTSDNYLIRISDVDDSNVYDISNSTFSILPSGITISTPNGGESWTVSSQHYITWSAVGLTYLNLYYSTNNGSTWTSIYNALTASNSYYNWYVPNDVSDSCLIKMEDYYNAATYDISDAVFSIVAQAPTITVTSPNTNVTWSAGSTQSITWNYTTVQNVKIEYTTNGGIDWNTIIASTPSSDQSYSWLVPSVASTQCKVRISDASNAAIYDVSDVNFTIIVPTITVTTPNNGEVWTENTYHYIYWNSTNISSYVNIYYSINGGSTWTSVAYGTYNYGYYYWYVPSTPSANCLVKIEDYYSNSIYDVSDSVFTIEAAAPSITVTTPNTYVNWAVGTNQYIYWTATSVSNVKIEYTYDGGSSWNTIIASTNASAGSYYWLIPNTPSTTCKVKVSNAADSTLYDISDNYFTISTPSITVTTPNNGEVWTANTYNYIYWTSSNISSYVNIYYSIDNGANWLSVAYGTYNYGYYNWYVANNPSTQCLIKVEDYYTNSIYDISDSVFTIEAAAPYITVTTPNTSVNWAVGSNQYIYWDSYNVTNVKIEYTYNGGSSWNTIIASTSASTGYYNWLIPNTPSTTCKVRISNAADSTLYDVSNTYFTISAPTITVTSPNGGEEYNAGSSYYIYWSATGTSYYYTIEYSINGGASWSTIVSNLYYYTYYNWTVPNTPSSNCLVRVKDYYNNSIYDVSNSTFTILPQAPTITVTSPNGYENWIKGSNHYITWTSTNVQNVKLEYTTDGTTWNLIVTSVAASSGSYYWTVPNYTTIYAKVRISDASNLSLNDESDNYFTISSPTITLTSPDGGEVWEVGSGHYIYWSGTGISSNVALEYSINNGASWSVISSYASNNGYYYWIIPNTPSTNCKVRVKDYNNSTVSDASNNVFTIQQPQPSVTLYSPNGGEELGTGNTFNITWAYANVTNVKLEYSIDNGNAWSTIILSTAANTQSYNWVVPSSVSNICLVKISSVADSTVYDISNAVFSIVNPTIIVTYPNGGETLYQNTGYYIKWNSIGASNYVKLDYSIDSGSTWVSITNYTYNYDQYYWTVPVVASTNCLIKVTDYNSSSVSDQSNAVFTIAKQPATLTITSPNGGESWITGSTHNIYWSSTSVQNVKIEFSSNSGSTWSTIIASVTNTGYYSWTTPSTASNQCIIKVTDVDNSSVYDYSNTTFSLVTPTLTLTSPDGFESWNAGTTHSITWTSSSISNYVALDYSTDGGTTWTGIVSYCSNNGSYNWYVPNVSSSTCKVRVKDYYTNSIYDISNNNFTIIQASPSITITSPNGGESIGTNSSKTITWTSTSVSNVKIEFSSNSGSTWSTIIASATNTGYYNWTTPATASTQCLIKVSDASNASVYDFSNYTFSLVTPTLTISSPNGGESWVGNSQHYITWSSSGASSYVKIEYTTGSTWTTIASSAYNNGYYYWTVPNVATTTCKVRVTDYYSSTINDVSDNNFTITTASPTITVTYPNGGETFTVGTTQNITWTSLSVANVKIEYSSNSGSTWNTIIASTTNTGSYSWTIPNTPSNACLIKVSDASSSSVYDFSNYTFKIANPNITVTSPNGGESFIVGSTQYISWSSAGVNYVNIEYSTDNAATWTTVINNTYNYGYYYWTVPNNPSTQCKVRVTNSNSSSITDLSDNTFTIKTATPVITLNSPNGFETYTVGSSNYIYWSSTAVSNVKIEYTYDNGLIWNTIVASYPANYNYYYWLTPNTPSYNCKVRISDVSNSSLNDVSNNNFRIAPPSPSITLTSPTGGEDWQTGSYHYITWNDVGVSSFNVEYSSDWGSTWTTLASNYSLNSYYWHVPSTISSGYYVRVSNYANTSLNDISSSFSVSNPSVTTNTIVVPKATTPVCKGDTISVRYRKTGTFNLGNIFSAQISDLTGSFSNAIELGYSIDTASGYVIGIVPEYLTSGLYKIRVVATDPSTIGTTSFFDVEIRGPEVDFSTSSNIVYIPGADVDFGFLGDTTTIDEYEWNFGTGETSNVMNPSYSYSFPGFYNVSLTVTDTNGCSASLTKYSNIRAERLFNNSIAYSGTSTITDLTIVNAQQTYASLLNGYMLVTNDSGAYWGEYATGTYDQLYSVDVYNNKAFAFGQNGASYYSNSNGATWFPNYFQTEDIYASAFTNTGIGFVVGENGYIGYYDGTIWSQMTSNTNVGLIGVDAVSGTNAWAVGSNGSIMHYNGTYWYPQSSGLTSDLWDVEFESTIDGMAVGDNGFIVQTSNGGTSWNVALGGVDVDFHAITRLNKDTAWAAGSNGIIYRTFDAGASWDRFSIGDNSDIYAIDAIPGFGYIGGENGLLRKFIVNTGTTGIGNELTFNAERELKVYPNPATEYITIAGNFETSSKVYITIKDMNGRLIDVVSNEQALGDFSKTVNISKLLPGIYFVHVQEAGRSWVQKIIKM